MIAANGDWPGNMGTTQIATNTVTSSVGFRRAAAREQNFADMIRKSGGVEAGFDHVKEQNLKGNSDAKKMQEQVGPQVERKNAGDEASVAENSPDEWVVLGIPIKQDGSEQPTVSPGVHGTSEIVGGSGAKQISSGILTAAKSGTVASPSKPDDKAVVSGGRKTKSRDAVNGDVHLAHNDVSAANGTGTGTNGVPVAAIITNATAVQGFLKTDGTVQLPGADGKGEKNNSSLPSGAAAQNIDVPVATNGATLADVGSNCPHESGSVTSVCVSSPAENELRAVNEPINSAAITQMHSMGIAQNVTSLVTPRNQSGATAGMIALHAQNEAPHEFSLTTFDFAKPNQLEVGLRGYEFGSLRVRAELGANGEVNAYLRGTSIVATDLLHTQIPKIEAYLGSWDVAVRSVHVETAWSHRGHSEMNLSGNSNGASQQQSFGRRKGSVSGETIRSAMESDERDEGVVPTSLVSSQGAVLSLGVGNWLSVRA